jgi:hypothetical protein
MLTLPPRLVTFQGVGGEVGPGPAADVVLETWAWTVERRADAVKRDVRNIVADISSLEED